MASGEGQRFGKYRLLDRLATGGMAEIYRARYTAAAGVTKELVIKKILPAFADNRRFVQMFIDEAKISVGLSHGNIAQVFDFGEIGGEYFLAMEFVDGQPLSRLLKALRGRGIPWLPSTFSAYVALQVCRGLHYAHTRADEHGKPLQIIHRDVSPQNVLLAFEGQVKLVDFGIAKARMAGRDETQTGAVKGKYLYFAPEQARGKELDARTDVYATGVLLYEMACGRLPFEGKMIEVLGKIVKGEFKRPRELNPSLTPAFERILLTAMAVDRGDRYPSAQALAEALSGYLYANAPTFGPEQVVRLLGWLYAEDLEADGRAPKLPREFLEQVEAWKAGAVEPGAVPAGETRAGLSDAPADPSTDGAPDVEHRAPPVPPEDTDAAVQDGMRTEAAPGRPRPPRTTRPMVRAAGRTRRWPWVALPVAAAVATGGAVVWTGRQEEPTPPPPAPVVAEPLPAATPAPPVPARPSPVEERGWPVAGELRLSTRRHAFALPASHAARIRLEPTRSYRAWVEPLEGQAGAVVFAQAEGGAPEALGPGEQQAVRISGASAFYAWTVAEGGPARIVRVQPVEPGSPSSTLRVEPRRHGLHPSALGSLLVTGLDPTASYLLSLEGTASPSTALALSEGPDGTTALLLGAGAPVTLSAASAVRLSLPDDRLDDNSGELNVKITPKN